MTPAHSQKFRSCLGDTFKLTSRDQDVLHFGAIDLRTAGNRGRKKENAADKKVALTLSPIRRPQSFEDLEAFEMSPNQVVGSYAASYLTKLLCIVLISLLV
jgi:hypothetical protein